MKRGIVFETVLGESWVHTRGEGSSGLWGGSLGLLNQQNACPPETARLASFCRVESGLASSLSRIKGHASSQARSHSPSRAGTGFGVSPARSCFLVLRRGKKAHGCPSVSHWLLFCCGRLYCSCLHLSRILSHTWQWMITEVSLAVANGGSLEIYPQSFHLMISLCIEGEEEI